MPQSAEKTVFQVVIPKDMAAVVDRIAEELEVSRSAFILACIEQGLDDFKTFEYIGMTPRRMRVIVDKLKKLGVIRQGDYEVNLRHLKAQ